MRNKIILLMLGCCMSMQLMSIDKEQLADTLSAFVHERAFAENVKVSNIRVKNQYVTIYTNKALSMASLSENDVREVRTLVSELVLGHKQGKVTIYTDGYELGELVTSLYRHRAKNARYTLPAVPAWVSNTSRAYDTKQGLDGKHIALWGSHGQYFHQPTESWRWQRAKVWSTVEDLYTSSYTMPFLVPMLENAGAVVVQPRERDVQVVEQVVDDSEAMGNGSWALGEGAGWATPEGYLLEGENPFEMGQYLVDNSTENDGSELRYMPSLPEGEYAVYVSYKSLPNSRTNAQYTVVHKGQKTTFSVNQKMGGGTWVYLGHFAFDNNPEHNYVSIANTGNPKQVVTSDAVKFGGGMGSVARYKQPDSFDNVPSSKDLPESEFSMDSVRYMQELQAKQAEAVTSGLPRYIEAARYWMQYSGIPDSIYNYTGSKNDYVDDYASRGIWVNYLAGGSAANPNEPGLGVPVHASLAFHTDAGVKDEVVGTLMVYKDYDDEKNTNFPTGKSRIIARDLADYMQTQIVEDMRSTYAPEWTRRQLNNSSYAEARHPKVPAVLLELLSHQNMTDMKYGLDPRVRFTFSRAMYKSFLRFIHEQYGTAYVVQPLPVQEMAMKRLGDEAKGEMIEVSWKATEDALEPTATPSYYVVYTRTGDSDWDNGVRVSDTKYSFKPEKGVRYDVCVAAGNAGGVSFKSEVMSAYIAPEEKGRVLVLNGFTRVSGPDWWADSTYAGIKPYSHAVPYGKGINYIGEVYDFERGKEWVSDDDCGWGMCHSDHMNHPTAGNTFDYVVMHGKVLAEMGYSYLSNSVDAVDSIAGYDAVDLILGKQKTSVLGSDTSFHCMSAKLQAMLKDYLAEGGRLMMSGAHIASDMNSAEDKAFIKEQLHYVYRCTNATRTGKLRVERLLPQGMHSFRIEPNDEIIHTENPDGIYPADGGVVVARYPEANVAAAIAHDGTAQGGSKTICWSLMLESAHSFDALYEMSMEWLMK